MKKILPIVCLLCISFLMSGCLFHHGKNVGTSGVRFPNAVANDSGNYVVVYQVNEVDKLVTYVQSLTPAYGTPEWSKDFDIDLVELYSEPGPSEGGGLTATLVRSQHDYTFILWEDAKGTHVQKMNISGIFLWNETIPAFNGTFSPRALTDGSGGMIVASPGADLKFQHIDIDGNILWETDSLTANAEFFDFTTDEAGNTYIVWQAKDALMYVQKLDAEGNIAWVSGGILLSDTHGTGDHMADITSDGVGGAIVTWIYAIYDKNKVGITGYELYTQRINAEGEPLWKTGGVPVSVMGKEPTIYMPVEPQIVGDGTGGAYIVWRGGMSIFVQRINASGELLLATDDTMVWNGDGAPISPLFNTVTDEDGGVIVVWNYIGAGQAIDGRHTLRTQRYDSSGLKKWGDNGILVFEGDFTDYITPMQIIPDGNHGVVIAFSCGPDIHHASISIFQRIFADGTIRWNAGGIGFGAAE